MKSIKLFLISYLSMLLPLLTLYIFDSFSSARSVGFLEYLQVIFYGYFAYIFFFSLILTYSVYISEKYFLENKIKSALFMPSLLTFILYCSLLLIALFLPCSGDMCVLKVPTILIFGPLQALGLAFVFSFIPSLFFVLTEKKLVIRKYLLYLAGIIIGLSLILIILLLLIKSTQ